jgi:hypothetical protein
VAAILNYLVIGDFGQVCRLNGRGLGEWQASCHKEGQPFRLGWDRLQI